ncbi:MAG: Rieske 2Fe-2S domain-containing protein [Candidatus Methylomirabilis sp.]|nr:Rieske 2Fe-2S domain-containing protein [Deltaproteobacteria bacterium]
MSTNAFARTARRVLRLCRVESIPQGGGRAFNVAGREIVVWRGRDGCVRALENRCPHGGGSLADGIVGDGKVHCPLHGTGFDLRTGESDDGARRRVAVYEAFVEAGEVRLEV